MASTARASLRGRLGVLIAGSLVVMALTTATAAASAPTPMGAAADLTRVRASHTATSWDGSSTHPRTGVPGFRLDRGHYTPVAIPRRLAATAPQGIVPTGINDRHQIVGEYIDDGLVSRGFLLDKRGRFTRIDVPGARLSQAVGINDRGQVVGDYQDSVGRYHGYLWDKGRFTTIDVPGAPATGATGINDRGQIVGLYANPTATPGPQPTGIPPMGRMA